MFSPLFRLSAKLLKKRLNRFPQNCDGTWGKTEPGTFQGEI